jgi:hypothetical protein
MLVTVGRTPDNILRQHSSSLQGALFEQIQIPEDQLTITQLGHLLGDLRRLGQHIVPSRILSGSKLDEPQERVRSITVCVMLIEVAVRFPGVSSRHFLSSAMISSIRVVVNSMTCRCALGGSPLTDLP